MFRYTRRRVMKIPTFVLNFVYSAKSGPCRRLRWHFLQIFSRFFSHFWLNIDVKYRSATAPLVDTVLDDLLRLQKFWNVKCQQMVGYASLILLWFWKRSVRKKLNWFSFPLCMVSILFVALPGLCAPSLVYEVRIWVLKRAIKPTQMIDAMMETLPRSRIQIAGLLRPSRGCHIKISCRTVSSYFGFSCKINTRNCWACMAKIKTFDPDKKHFQAGDWRNSQQRQYQKWAVEFLRNIVYGTRKVLPQTCVFSCTWNDKSYISKNGVQLSRSSQLL